MLKVGNYLFPDIQSVLKKQLKELKELTFCCLVPVSPAALQSVQNTQSEEVDPWKTGKVV